MLLVLTSSGESYSSGPEEELIKTVYLEILIYLDACQTTFLLTDIYIFFLLPANPILAVQTPRTQHQLQLRNMWKLQLQGTQSLPKALCCTWSQVSLTRILAFCFVLGFFFCCWRLSCLTCVTHLWFPVRNGGTLTACAAWGSPTRLTSPTSRRLRTPSPVRILRHVNFAQ